MKIEDKEDVIALQQAKREIDDEFDEDAVAIDTNNSTVKEKEEEVAVAKESTDLERRSAQQLSRELKRSEFINWRTHPTLNEVTRSCIEYFEGNYAFDAYLDDRSKKDTKFVNPLNEDEEKKKVLLRY